MCLLFFGGLLGTVSSYNTVSAAKLHWYKGVPKPLRNKSYWTGWYQTKYYKEYRGVNFYTYSLNVGVAKSETTYTMRHCIYRKYRGIGSDHGHYYAISGYSGANHKTPYALWIQVYRNKSKLSITQPERLSKINQMKDISVIPWHDLHRRPNGQPAQPFYQRYLKTNRLTKMLQSGEIQ